MSRIPSASLALLSSMLLGGCGLLTHDAVQRPTLEVPTADG
jgi:hypothetical protein